MRAVKLHYLLVVVVEFAVFIKNFDFLDLIIAQFQIFIVFFNKYAGEGILFLERNTN